MKQFNTWERYFDPKHPSHQYQVTRHEWFIDRVHGPKLLDVGCLGGLALYKGMNPPQTQQISQAPLGPQLGGKQVAIGAPLQIQRSNRRRV